MSRFRHESVKADTEECDAADVFVLTQFEQVSLNSERIKRETTRDKVLSRVYEHVMKGWDTNNEKELLPYFNRRNELTISQGCLLWGIRVVVPQKYRQQTLELLHSAHPGVVKMKVLARSYVWWPNIDSDIEVLVKSCTGCQKHHRNPSKAPLHPWEWPSTPWKRIHIDFAGPFMDHMFLIAVDAHSKWPEVIPMTKTTATKTTQALRTIFSRNGLPEQIVSDNGPQFVSEEFQQFTKLNGITHIKSAPYHPATNGLAERFVQTFKQSMRAMKGESCDLHKKLANFLLVYRNTPHSITNETPAKLLMGRQLKTRLDLIKPDITRQVHDKQMKRAIKSSKENMREFEEGQAVAVRNYHGKDKWTSGQIIQREGPLNYKVETTPGNICKRHADQIRKSDFCDTTQSVIDPDIIIPETTIIEKQPDAKSSDIVIPTTEPAPRRYPLRIRKPVVKLDL